MKTSTPFPSAKTSVSRSFALGTVAAVSVIMVASITGYSQKRATARAKKLATSNAEEIAKRVLPSVVLIVCEDGKGNTSIGSGFFVRAVPDPLEDYLDKPDWWHGSVQKRPSKGSSAAPNRSPRNSSSATPPMIVTSFHVIKGMIRGTARIAIDHRRQNWRITDILNYDEQSDLALLGLDEYDDIVYSALSGSRMRPLPLASTAAVRPGQTVYALGNPEGLVGSISQGIISAAPRAFKGGARIQLTAAISPGSSGGPVVNSTGAVVGIAQGFFEEGQNLNFAVPVSFLSQLLDRTPSVLRFDDWERARSQRKSEEDWLWIPRNAGVKPEEDLEAGIVSGREPVPEWQLVASGGGEEYYVSRVRIIPTPEHTFIAWTKVVPHDSPEGRTSRKETIDNLNTANVSRSYAFSYTISQQEFDCGHHKKRRLRIVDYDQKGELLYDWGDPPGGTGWESVLPDSIGEAELNFVCKGKQ